MASAGKIWANKEGHEPSRLHQVEGDIEDLVLQLEATDGSIKGVVLDPDGRTVAHATVAVAFDFGIALR